MVRHVHLEPTHVIRRRSIDQPLRISLDFLNISRLEDPYRIKDVLQNAREYFSQTLKVRKTVPKILLQRKCLDNNFFLKSSDGKGPGRVRFCRNGCNETRFLCGPIEIPAHDLDQCRLCDEDQRNCGNDTRPRFAAGRGHDDTDFVLYVTALANTNCNNTKTLAYAAACQQESGLDRPVVGFINICPDKVTARELRTSYNDVLATIKHEIFHALGFSPSMFAFFRNTRGDPLTPRLGNGLPRYVISQKLYEWSAETVKVVTRENWLTRSGTVSHPIHVMATPRVKEEAQKHFNCSSLEGAELENQGGKGTKLAHWEKRIFGNEGMTGIFTQYSVFSRLTLALMEDTGWYKVNYEMAEPLLWGKNLGCLFAKNSCGAWIKAQRDADQSIAPFCNITAESSDGRTGCSVDSRSVAKCNLVKYGASLPIEYQNFLSGYIPGADGNEGQYGGTVALADYCPFYQGFTWTKEGKGLRSSSCVSHHNNLEQDKNLALEIYSNSSACIEQTMQWTRRKCGVRYTASNWGGGCYRYMCEHNSLKVLVFGYKFNCFHEGQHIKVLVEANGWEYRGGLVCPSCEVVCHGSGITCAADVIPAPENSQPIPKISAVTCSQCSIHISHISFQLVILLCVFKLVMMVTSS
ncbi:leishmanolysin-like peptidase [Montipora foliosa]|uniref:leishmanolysin-like peptidase n=1 Tax=Montipora foliosa TaxID=591990 RepID=UPI0035F17226